MLDSRCNPRTPPGTGTPQAAQPSQPSTPDDLPALAFPTCEEDFGWSDLVTSDVIPRPTQVHALVWSLACKSSIVVMPTGSGKTLVASLFLARMCRLNPGRIGVLVVDRVPLVFQQARALACDTGLKALRLCSETRTEKSLERLRDGTHYQCVVSTAGSLMHLLESGDLPIACISALVFDECHHATGGHDYNKILTRIQTYTLENGFQGPRILGLRWVTP